jgi:2'-5' RNA ligase
MAESAFIVRVPEAEACVSELRNRFDASVRLGVPAHITVLAPSMPPNEISAVVIRKVQATLSAHSPFQFKLRAVRRFPATAYLAPEPAGPFVALTEALSREFPSFPPFRGEHPSVVPHLTVANGSAAEAALAAQELQRRLETHGPILSTCMSVALLENSTGMWNEAHVFPLVERDG